jgi:universal stress protein A
MPQDDSTPEELIMIPKKILFCTDFSENSERACRCAAEYSKAFGADLTVIHVIESWAGFPVDREDVLGVVHKMEETANNRLELLAKELGTKNGNMKTHSTIGVPAEDIVLAAKQEHADLIVMGTHGWTGVRHLLLGSVAEKVLRTAGCPVLVVRPAEGGSAKE